MTKHKIIFTIIISAVLNVTLFAQETPDDFNNRVN